MCNLEVKEAAQGDYVVPGRALIAPGDFHMVIRKVEGTYRAHLKQGPRVCYQRPAVDVMFASVADVAGPHAIGVILTGMGADGAEGMVKLKKAGGRNIAQDEQSCVVFGMPREAIRLGGPDQVLPLNKIPKAILSLVATSNHHARAS